MYTMEDNKAVVVAVAVAVLLVVVSRLKSWFSSSAPAAKLNLPPGPWMLPVIGSIHHLAGNPLTYRKLRELAQRHGPLMMLRLGEVPTLVVSSAEAAEAVLKTHDVAFSDRYTSTTLKAISYDGTDVACAPYGERWRQLRKICVLELLSSARVQSFRRVREEEVSRFMWKLAASAAAGDAVDMTEGINRWMTDTFSRECVGDRCKSAEDYIEAFHTAFRQTSGLSVADLFPSSRLMQALGSAPRKALACRHRMHSILEQILQEQREALERGDDAATNGSFITVLLRLQKEGGTAVELTDETIASIMFDMFSAGSDTSASELNWCVAELVRCPAVMAKAQAEVRRAFEGKGAITEDDLDAADLRYLKLVIKETLRMHTQIPLLLPRQCRESCRVMGYDIPKGTTVLVNVWAIGRERRHWGDDAEEFRPERFAEEKSGVEYKGTDYEYLPFGAGRRMCPGMNLGVRNIELVLASLLYHFDWKLPHGEEPGDMDMWEAVGLVGNKRTHLLVHPVTRVQPTSTSSCLP